MEKIYYTDGGWKFISPAEVKNIKEFNELYNTYQDKISKVSLIAFTKNDIGNAFWRKIGWTQRMDLNYYDFTLNTENIIRFNQ